MDFSSKGTGERMKTQGKTWKNVFANGISKNEVIFRINKELSKLNK